MRTTGRRIVDAWNRFWFRPAERINLAGARVLIAVHGLWMLLSRDYAALSGVPKEFWQAAPPGVGWRYLIFPGHQTVETLIQAAAIAALVGVLLDVFPRACALIAGAAIYHLAPFEVAIWSPTAYGRGLTLEPLLLPILAFSRLERPAPWSWRRRPAPSWEFNWPLRLIELLVCEIYLFSVYGKLVRSGLAWGSAEHMRQWLLYLNLDPRRAAFQAPGLWLADHPALCLLMGVSAMVFELGFIVVLFRPSTRKWLVPTALLFHATILVTLNIHVPEAWLLLVFIDWAWIRNRVLGAGDAALGPETPNEAAAGARLQAIADVLRRSGGEVEATLEGRSMEPTIPAGATIRIRGVPAAEIQVGDVVAIPMEHVLMVHRVVIRGRRGRARGFVVTRGDGLWLVDPPAPVSEILGVVTAMHVGGSWRSPGPAQPPLAQSSAALVPALVFRGALAVSVGLALWLGEWMKTAWLLQEYGRVGLRRRRTG